MAPAKGKTSKKPDELINHGALKHNLSALNFLRNFVSVVAGIAIGILGVVGWHGFLYHFASQVAVSACMFLKGCTNPKHYFTSWSVLLTYGTFSSTTALSYILFWMIFYNLCHVF